MVECIPFNQAFALWIVTSIIMTLIISIISFTLSNCKTITEVSFTKKEGSDFSFDVYFEGEKNEAFKPKIQTFFERIEAYVPFLRDFHFKIDTSNTFPHSSGIASSASGMSALALCLMSIEKQLGVAHNTDFFNKKAFYTI